VIATSVSREAKNIDKVAGWLEKNYQLRYTIISEQREIDYNFAAIRSSIAGVEDFIGFDIGGGSTEFICCESGKQTIGESLDIGLMKLINRFSDTNMRIQAMKSALDGLSLSPPTPYRLIGIGLSMAYITLIIKRLKKYDYYQVHGQTIQLSELQQLKATLERSDISAITEYMVEPNSREILALSVEFVILILDKYGASEIIVCDYGISLGYIIWNKKKSKSRKQYLETAHLTS
jgi:exopolyphosphatase/guanosine-5'-triphosphate,3'-diphosphate pyrophosphatase